MSNANEFASFFSPESAVVKTLDSRFDSLADAMFSYAAHRNAFDSDKGIDAVMVKTFCHVNRIEYNSFATDEILSREHYFKETLWAEEMLEKYGFYKVSGGAYLKLNENNHPVAMVVFSGDGQRNLSISANGSVEILLSLWEVIKTKVHFDEVEEAKSDYIEIVDRDKMSILGPAGKMLTGESKKVEKLRVVKDAYYPYLTGGILALLKDFIASDSSVLILMGPPGTGKSSGLSAAIAELNLLPIYSSKTALFKKENFIETILGISDRYMDKVVNPEVRSRQELFDTSSPHLLDKINRIFTLPFAGKTKEKVEPKVPVVLIEDGDLLLAPRSEGNEAMSELLNAADGIGSRYSRKLIFTTNITDKAKIDPALLREGRCYGAAPIVCRLLNPMEAVEARAAFGLPPFEVVPTTDISLAEALAKPRKNIYREAGYVPTSEGKACH